MAPQIDYFTMVMMPIVEKLGVKFEVDIVRRGYYPKGNALFTMFAAKCMRYAGACMYAYRRVFG